ncbi:MAG: hypothetical protein OXJ90_20220 [Spirochaetaceae bacterium]|nr:hypothetical protein [Spirochaetaceae bacterium]
MVGGAFHRWTVRGAVSGIALLIKPRAAARTYRYHAREHGEPFLCDRPRADEGADDGRG